MMQKYFDCEIEFFHYIAAMESINLHINLYLIYIINNFENCRIQEFPREPSLHAEIDNIIRAVQSSNSLFSDSVLNGSNASSRSSSDAQSDNDPNFNFLCDLFHALPKCEFYDLNYCVYSWLIAYI